VKNTFLITEISHQLVKIHERIESLTSTIAHNEMEGNEELVSVYADMRLDELEHAQKLTLTLTQMIIQDTDSPAESEHTDENDGSVFAEGDLTDTKDGEEAETESEVE
jgi:hypothetical protein